MSEPVHKQDLNRLRNALHNEVGITKQEIRDMVELAVKHIVEKKVKQMVPNKEAFDRLVDQAVKDRSLLWSKKDSEFNSNIEQIVARELSKKIKIEVKVK